MEVSYLEHCGYVIYEETEDDIEYQLKIDFILAEEEYAESVTYTDTVSQVTTKEVK